MKNIEYTDHNVFCDIKVDGIWQRRIIKEVNVTKMHHTKMIPELRHNEMIIETTNGTEIITL